MAKPKESSAQPIQPNRKTGQWIVLFVVLILITLAVAQQKGYIDLKQFSNIKESLNNVMPTNPPVQSPVELTSLSSTTGLPGQLITVYGTGFDRTSTLLVRFSDEQDYNVLVSPAQVTDNRVIVSIPPFVNFDNFTFAAGTVDVQIVKDLFASNPVKLSIHDLPPSTAAPGKVTLQFLDEAIGLFENTKKHLLLAEKLKLVTIPNGTIEALDAQKADYTLFRKQVALAVSGQKIEFGSYEGETLYFDKETLRTTDRLFLTLMQLPSAQETNLITGAVVGSSATCRQVEGLELSVVIACIEKHYDLADEALGLIEDFNEMHVNDPLIGKGFGAYNFLSDLSFVALTLPGMYQSYQEELSAVTALTGAPEYEKAALLQEMYIDKLVESTSLGKGMATLRDIFVGPHDEMYRRIIYGGRSLDDAYHLQFEPLRSDQDSGISKVKCGDLCDQKPLTNFAIMAGVEGNGKLISMPRGINCPGDCNEIYDSTVTQVSIIPVPDKGFALDKWSLACAGKGKCTILSGKDQAVIATFKKEPEKLEIIPDQNDNQEVITSKCPKTSCDTGSCCGSTDRANVGPITPTVSGVLTHRECPCPNDTKLVGEDNVAAGGPWNICGCI